MCRRSIRPSLTGWASLFLGLFIFTLELLAGMPPVCRISGHQHGITLAPHAQHDKIILRLKPEQNPPVAVTPILPCFDAWVMGMIDDGSNPSDALATAKIRRSARLHVAFLYDVPKRPFPVLVFRFPPQANSASPQIGH